MPTPATTPDANAVRLPDFARPDSALPELPAALARGGFDDLPKVIDLTRRLLQARRRTDKRWNLKMVRQQKKWRGRNSAVAFGRGW